MAERAPWPERMKFAKNEAKVKEKNLSTLSKLEEPLSV